MIRKSIKSVIKTPGGNARMARKGMVKKPSSRMPKSKKY